MKKSLVVHTTGVTGSPATPLLTTSRCLATSIALALALSGCIFLPERQSPPALHDFGPAPGPAASRTGEQQSSPWSTVSVEAPEWLQTDNIRYRLLYSEPTRVRFYARDRWLAPPPALFAHRLTMQSCGQRHDLNVMLTEFEQVFDEPKRARVVLAFQAEASKPDSGETVGRRMFRFTLASPSADASGAVSAFSVLMESAAHSLENWMTQLP